MKILSPMYLWTRTNILHFARHLHLDPNLGILKDFLTLQDGAFFTI